MAHEIAGAHAPEEARTPAAAERRDLRQELARSLHSGKGVPADVIAARKAGKLSKLDITEAFRAARETPFERAFTGLGIDDALRVYKAANAAEKKQVQAMFMKKARSAIEKGAPAERAQTVERVRAAIAGR